MRLVVYFYVFLYDYTLHEAVFVDKINVLCFKFVFIWISGLRLVIIY